jgi:hypothetical protein
MMAEIHFETTKNSRVHFLLLHIFFCITAAAHESIDDDVFRMDNDDDFCAQGFSNGHLILLCFTVLCVAKG